MKKTATPAAACDALTKGRDKWLGQLSRASGFAAKKQEAILSFKGRAAIRKRKMTLQNEHR